MRDKLVEVDLTDKVYDVGDEPVPHARISTAQTSGRRVINVWRRNQFATLAEHLS